MKPGDGPQQRRLSAARWAEKGHELPFFDDKIDAMQHMLVLQAYVKIVKFNRVHVIHPLSLCSSRLFRT
ncbi:hypothetical protein D3C73_1617550 [compost metagenome]